MERILLSITYRQIQGNLKTPKVVLDIYKLTHILRNNMVFIVYFLKQREVKIK
jgi:hypothetical protein